MTDTPATPSRPLRLSWPDLFIGLTVIIWGVNFVVVKAALAEFSPLSFNSIRFTLATLVELVVLYAQGETLAMPWRDLKKMLPIALLGVLSYQLLFVFGIRRTTAGNASVLLATIPIFVALYTGIFRRQKLGQGVWLGSALTFTGVCLLTLGSGKPLAASLQTLPGDLLLLVAAVGWAAYTVGAKSLLERYSAIKLTALSMLITAPVMDLLSIPELLSTDWAAISTGAWVGLLYSAVFSIAIAYLFWNIAVQRLGDARSATYSNLTPIVSLVTAWIVLNERLAPLQILGAIIVLAGVWLARFGRRRRRAAFP